MSSTTRYILLGVVIAALLALFIYIRGKEKKQLDWKENYIEKNKDPFGSHVIHEILKTYFPDKKCEDLKDHIAKSLPKPDSLKEPANYVFIGDGLFADTADTDKLLLFVQEGHHAFIAANALPNYLLENIFKDSCDDGGDEYNYFRTDWVDSANLNFNHPQLIENKAIKYEFLIAGKKRNYDWSYIDTLRGECTEGAKNITPLGNFNDENMNFIKVDYGKGSIFIHSNPIAFTNFHLLDSTKLRYAAKAFSHLIAGTIYWDTKSRVSRDVIRRMNGSNIRLEKDGPLKYILAQPALRWAWFIGLALIGLYLFFAAKRQQRTIPVLEDKSNTSLEFIQTIGQMYFRQGEHIRLCDMMLKQFQTFVRDRYHLASREMNEDFIQTLAIKSDVPLERIKTIVGYENLIYRNSITEDSMVDFYQTLNVFYKNCK
jgi:hypothetical protein